MGSNSYDFSGWATKNDLKCADGRVIRKDAFKHNDGEVVSLVWDHKHDGPGNILGHALLENRDEGVYAYCSFNNSRKAQEAKEAVKHGDVRSLSIYANQLVQSGSDVMHGMIREVSLVIAGANPGAFIDNVLMHGIEVEEDAIISANLPLEFAHSAMEEGEKKDELEHSKSGDKEKEMEDTKKKSADEETVEDVFNTLDEKQKTVVYAIIGQAVEDAKKDAKHSAMEEIYEELMEDDDDDFEDEGDEEMKHNIFENDQYENQQVLMHEAVGEIIGDAKRYGSLKESVLAHSQDYGIVDIDFLFPDAKAMENEPGFIKRKDDWISSVMNGVHHGAFARVKSVFADITEDEARAKGYMKGNLKTNEVFTLLKRITTPTTVYKKQTMDRDDVIDITSFNVIAWLKREMRMMLDEEIARAILIGDGRPSAHQDKIKEDSIRPVWTDSDLFTIKQTVVVAANASDDDKAKAFIRSAVKSRKNYKGSGNPVLYTTEDMLTDMILLEDTTGRKLYESEASLAAALRVSKIVTVPVMEGQTRKGDNGATFELGGIIVNLADYNVGMDKGGEISMFDDFDIDYNQQKYLIETRMSGALVKPYSAIALEFSVPTKTTGGSTPSAS